MKFLSKKQRIDLEIELYRKERQFEIDSKIKKKQLEQELALENRENEINSEILWKKKNLLNDLEKCREENDSEKTKLLSEIAGLEAKKESINAEVETLKKMVDFKDAEIKRMQETINLLVKDYPKVGVSGTTINK